MSLQISETNSGDILAPRKLNMKSIENEDQNVIFSLLECISVGKEITYSYKIFPKYIILTISDMEQSSLELLTKLYLVSDRVKGMQIDFRASTLVIKIKKMNAELKVEIKKRIQYEKEKAEQHSTEFVSKNDIRDEDKRLVKEIVMLFYKWTWHSAACDIRIDKVGDHYKFKVHNLLTISYNQVKKLDSIGSWIEKIHFDFKLAVLSFDVSRTKSIKTEAHPSKRQRYM